MLKNVGGQIVAAHMRVAADLSDYAAGAVEVYIAGDNGAQTLGSVGSGLAADKGNGLWTYAPAQAETNFDHVVFTFISVGTIVAVSESKEFYPESLLTGARAEPGQGNPPASLSALGKLDYLYKTWRNRIVQTATEQRLFNDAGDTVDQKRAVLKDETEVDRGKMESGA